MNQDHRKIIISKLKQRAAQIWQSAQVHKKASQVGLHVDFDKFQTCCCCDQVVEKQPISLFKHAKQLQVFGIGYPLWFSYLKYCIILVFILIANKTANQLYRATNQNYHFCYGKLQSELEIKKVSNLQKIIQKKQQKSNQKYNNEWIFISKPFHLRREKHKLQNNQFHQISKFNYDNFRNYNKIKKYQDMHQSSSHSVPCTSFMVYLSIFKRQQMHESLFLRIVQFLIYLFTLIGIRNLLEKQKQIYQERKVNISGHSLMITNLPKSQGTQNNVLDLFGLKFNKKFRRQIQQFIFVFKDDFLLKLCEQQKHIKSQIISAQTEFDQQKQKQFYQKLNRIQQKIKKQSEKIRINIQNDAIKAEKAILVMNTQNDKGSVLSLFLKAKQSQQSYQQLLKGTPFQGQKNIKIINVPQPNQIIWQNLYLSQSQHKKLNAKGWCMTILFLTVVTVAFYFILLAKTNLFLFALQKQVLESSSQKAQKFKFLATFLAYFAIFSVVIFNKFLMGKIIYKFVQMERHSLVDDENYSFALKYALGMFFTTALMTLAVEAITFQNFYVHSFGVIEEETIMFFVTAFFIPLFRYQGKFVSQEKANQLIQDYPYDLGKRYAEIFEMMWFTFLYSQLIPLGSFLIVIGLFIYYWVDKYNFLRRSTLKTGNSGKLAILGLKSLDATLFLSPAGDFLFDFIIHKRVNYLQIFFIIAGLIYMFIPISKIIWYINGQKFILQQKQFQYLKAGFKQTYYSFHPVYKITHKKQIQEHKQRVKKYYRQKLQKPRHYRIGRGKYKKDTYLQNSTFYKSTMGDETIERSEQFSSQQKNSKNIYSPRL